MSEGELSREERKDLDAFLSAAQDKRVRAGYIRLEIDPEGLRLLGEAGATLIVIDAGAVDTTLTQAHIDELRINDHIHPEYIQGLDDD